GVGKTSLLRLLNDDLNASGGALRVTESRAILDQQVALLDRGDSIAGNFRRLNPGTGETELRAALARFRFRAEAALQKVGTLSGGQMLRAGLACVLGVRPPELLLLDEPTNHLDLDALEAVEAGLRAYRGALIVVSHDRRFLREIGVTRELVLGPSGPAPAPGRGTP
ncbi:MAG: ABC-F family ATP-binding cassette domain-containing protein, partial [Candidatus Competibacteraceae bacterium]|nr:ABC-F family ATP-binding cassette domain-containing protein [Candidatus Competibacteraceae bacterium]